MKSTVYNLNELIARCVAKPCDRHAWQQFIDRYQADLRAGVQQVIGFAGGKQHCEMVADYVQDAWVRLLTHDRRPLRAFRGKTEGELRAYLRKVASSATLNRLRAAKRSLVASYRLDGAMTKSGCPGAPIAPSEEEQFLLAATIDQTLDQELPEKNKHDNLRAFFLYLHRGLNSRAIVSALRNRLTARAIDNRLWRMRKLLRKRLLAQGF